MSMYFLYGLLSADPSADLGRPDYALLPQQTQMELFIEKTGLPVSGAKEKITGSYNDLVNWKSVTLNNQGEVVSFRFWHLKTAINLGELDFQLLPSTVERIDVYILKLEEEPTLSFHGLPSSLKSLEIPQSAFHGTLDTACLPRQLEVINIRKNKFSGSLKAAHLPQTLQVLLVHCNRFSGPLDFPALPPDMRQLNISNNEFSGSVDLTRLSKTIELLIIHTNEFSGVIDLSALPPRRMNDHYGSNDLTLIGFSVGNNRFDTLLWKSISKRVERIDAGTNALKGPFEAMVLPSQLKVLKVNNNQYEGPLSLKDLPPGLRFLDASSNRLSGQLDLTVLPSDMQILLLSKNAFEGSLDFSWLPKRFEQLDLSSNGITGPMAEITFGKTHLQLKSIDLSDNKICEDRVRVVGMLSKWATIDLRGNEIGSANRPNVKI